MRSPSSTNGQLILFPGVTEAAAPPQAPAARRRPTRVERKVAELERIAETAEREMADSFRRAAEILRAGPSGVAGVLGGHHEAA